MNFKTLAPLKVFLLGIAIVSQFSCSKDSDLLTDFVLSETQNTLDLSELILDDTFIINSKASITLDVLANDNFENTEDVIITETSEPENGTVTINTDNTLTYTPNETPETTTTEESVVDTAEETVDTFTYTTEVANEDATTSTATGNVTVTVTDAENKAPTTGDNVYFVTTAGKSNNNGATEATAWNIQHAFKTAKAGDVVYIKAGLYSGFNITQNTNGTADSPIRFIGYKDTPGDIDPDAQENYTLGTQTIKVLSSFSYGDKVDINRMPLMQESSTTSIALNLKGNYVEIYNFQIQNYGIGLQVSGDHSVIKNIIAIDQGNQSSRVAEGFSVNNLGNNNTWKNIYIENGGQQGFRNIYGNHNNFDAVTVTCDNNVNATDYYFLFEEGSNNRATNIFVKRIGNIEHYGHGIVFKDPNEVTNNIVDGFIIDNTVLEPQFPGVHHNTFKNGYIVIQSDSWGSQNHGGMTLGNGSYSNTFENIYLKDAPIRFTDWKDGRGGDVAKGSDDNTFSQITIDLTNRKEPAIRFNFFTTGSSASFGSSNGNTFYNCTFYNGDYIFEDSRENTNTQFINCIFDNFKNYKITQGGGTSYGIDVNFVNSNFSNINFGIPTGTNISSTNLSFSDVNKGDFSLKSGNPLEGMGIETPFLPAGNDLGAVQ